MSSMNIDVEKLAADLERDEGKRLEPYFDSEGFVTFGIGHNLHANPLQKDARAMGKIWGFNSEQFVRWLLKQDIKFLIADLERFTPVIAEMPEEFQRGIANMAFQMGIVRLIKFKKAWAYYSAKDYQLFVHELKDSEWYRKYTSRAERVIALIESGIAAHQNGTT